MKPRDSQIARERDCTADVIAYLTEIDRRRLHAAVRDELRTGAIHLTGLWLLAPFLTDDNAESLLAEARGKTRRQIEELLARRFPRPDVSQRICPEPQQQSMPTASGVAPGPGPATPVSAPASSYTPAKLRPLSESRWSVQLSIGSELKAKIDETPAAAQQRAPVWKIYASPPAR